MLPYWISVEVQAMTFHASGTQLTPCGLDDVGQILAFTGLQDFPPCFQQVGGLISVWENKNLGSGR